jgi:hypothetical protein
VRVTDLVIFLTIATFPTGTPYNENDDDADYDDNVGGDDNNNYQNGVMRFNRVSVFQ